MYTDQSTLKEYLLAKTVPALSAFPYERGVDFVALSCPVLSSSMSVLPWGAQK